MRRRTRTVAREISIGRLDVLDGFSLVVHGSRAVRAATASAKGSSSEDSLDELILTERFGEVIL